MDSTNKFIKGLEKELNVAYTENGATVYRSTNNKLLDFYSKLGSLRKTATDEEIISLFLKTYKSDKTLAVRALFYGRDIREGIGERRLFRVILKYLATTSQEVVEQIIEYIPEYGRWDDLFELFETPCQKMAINMLTKQLLKDSSASDGEPISLLAKWMPSVNASNKRKRELAAIYIKNSYMSKETYKKLIKKLRSRLDVVEKKMCSNKWDTIEYDKVPSLAYNNYSQAFKKHSPERFTDFIQEVKEGKSKINANVVTPMEIFKKGGFYYNWNGFGFKNWTEEMQVQWDSLPNFVQKDSNILVLADTSASMNGDPILASLSLALYFATRNTGAWADYFMVFSALPQLVKVNRNSSVQKNLEEIEERNGCTYLEKAFDLILTTAIDNNLKQEEMPQSLLIISDGEFDREVSKGKVNDSFFDTMRNKFNKHGYELPNIVSWNVQDRNGNSLALKDSKNIQFASGYSTNIFKNICKMMFMTPFDAMMEVLNSERYSNIFIK